MPRGEKTIAFQLRFRPALLKELEEIASADGLSIAALMRVLAERHVRSARLSKLISDREDFGEMIQKMNEYDRREAALKDSAQQIEEALVDGRRYLAKNNTPPEKIDEILNRVRSHLEAESGLAPAGVAETAVTEASSEAKELSK